MATVQQAQKPGHGGVAPVIGVKKAAEEVKHATKPSPGMWHLSHGYVKLLSRF